MEIVFSRLVCAFLKLHKGDQDALLSELVAETGYSNAELRTAFAQAKSNCDNAFSIKAVYVSDWAEGDIRTNCVIDKNTGSIIDVDSEECDYEELISESVEVERNGRVYSFPAEDGDLTAQGKKEFLEMFS